MDGSVTLDDVMMRFDDFTAIEPTRLTIESGEFFSFLGPSGCGKTTLLNIISGFLTPSEGQVRIGGEPMASVPVNRRPTAMIFQNLALFPLMSVYRNIEFGLEVRNVGRAERRRRADELLDLVALGGSGDKPISALSGGQKQRVAIARALAVEPRVLLLDEPLSALDLKLRQHMRTELKAIQRKTGITFIYITHDQGEALTMSDRVAVMSAGRIQQVADPETLYQRPATAFVAAFVGENNRLPGRVVASDGETTTLDVPGLGRLAGRTGQAQLAVGQSAALFVRPEHLRLDTTGDDTRLEGDVTSVSFEGAWRMLEVCLADGSTRLRVLLGQGAGPAANPVAGHRVELGYAPRDAVVLTDDAPADVDAETGEPLASRTGEGQHAASA
ncbi:ABC transporter ATP-binding protein [Modicisalibacter coralii]|uniref:ABC transporter ATP-binding protein n=1 Tax=Modicisalibacter coralii TaxID=2304602 RepID=UPI00100ABAC3|nr:ABC transporter ATP-binding protein [Halomonas coralii]